jgi:polar amino acid transport system permease protein
MLGQYRWHNKHGSIPSGVPQFFNLALLLNNGPALAWGAVETLALSGAALALSFVCGLAGWLCRASRRRPLAWLGFGYVELFRNTPTLIYLYLFYFGLPMIGVRLGAFVYAMLAIGIQGGAYVTEIIRGAYAAIGDDQRMAAQALGLRHWQSLALVELPQMFSVAFPALGNQVISTVLGTALASVIAVPELTYQLQIIGDSTYQYFSVFSLDAIAYLILVQILSQSFQAADRRWFSKWRGGR